MIILKTENLSMINKTYVFIDYLDIIANHLLQIFFFSDWTTRLVIVISKETIRNTT